MGDPQLQRKQKKSGQTFGKKIISEFGENETVMWLRSLRKGVQVGILEHNCRRSSSVGNNPRGQTSRKGAQ